MKFRVLRSFESQGRTLERGEVVTDEGWQPGRAEKLVAQRYLAPEADLQKSPSARAGKN